MRLMISLLLTAWAIALPMSAQSLEAVQTATPAPDYQKMSAWVRTIVREGEHRQAMLRKTPQAVNRRVGQTPLLTAFVRVDGDGQDILTPYQARVLTQMDDICIAQLPIDALSQLSINRHVLRIEANRTHHLTMDTTAQVIHALPVYDGASLPQAYTGQGVVVGVQDIGFDLTHPTFFDTTGTRYRVSRLWDMLSVDTIGSALPVGAEYTTGQDILALGCVRDGTLYSHGTHTTGTAAGSGYGTPYRGMAYESDICLVANAVSDDLPLISPDDIYKYTYATDALGFKYIFDYADAVGKPAVVSFSEGSHQDFRGDDVLFYEMLDKIVGPGHILVASAGNEGLANTYLHKPAEQLSEGAIIQSLGSRYFAFTVRGQGDYGLRFTARHHDATTESVTFSPAEIMALPESVLTDTLRFAEIPYFVQLAAYRSCYNDGDMVIEGHFSTVGKVPVSEGSSDSIAIKVGQYEHLTLELVGAGSDIQLFVSSGYIHDGYGLQGGEASHNVHSPGSAPAVICVGANTHRRGFINQFGNYIDQEVGYQGQGNGARACFSSTGPTFDGRVKPDVVAPGTNVMASYSSWVGDPPATLTMFTDFQGRTYPWGANSGTSMATPVVAGAIALWLQANPRLTPDDIRGVLSRTCKHVASDPDAVYPNNEVGYGEIDVYRGLVDVLALKASIGDLSDFQPGAVRFRLSDGGRLQLSFDRQLTAPARWQVYSLGGVRMMQGSIDPGCSQAQIDLSSLSPAVYAIQIDSPTPSVTGSTLVRIK